jgi:hypothetical protein
VRQLAGASVADGRGTVTKYVRHQRTTLIEIKRRQRELAQAILDKQVGP